MNAKVRTGLAVAISVLAATWIWDARPLAAQTAPIVTTRSGSVQGVVDRDVFAFKGLPYAAPPVGALRWREPRPAPMWQGVRNGGAFGGSCIQPAGLSAANGAGDPGPLSEDCLYLNVWTPKADSAADLPVMVWIHGGAYIFGSGSVQFYNGAPLAKKGAVVVTINYRLGQLGFFAHPALAKENPGTPANFGLLDQIAALKWVRDNIAAFGGNPNNVTILGQSAGAKSVVALYASPLARGLFHRGIALSTYAIPYTTKVKATEVGLKVADALGLKGAKATAAALRAVPAEKFAAIKGQGLSNAPLPIAGDSVLPQSIQDTFALGKEAALPLILGNTSDDASVVAGFGVDPAAILQRMRVAGFLVQALYPGVKGDAELARQITRDIIFTNAVRQVADRHSKLAPTWRYYFDYTAVKDRSKYPNGVPHGAEIVYFLDTGDAYDATKAVFTDQDRDYARRISGYVIEFARNGRPAAIGAVEWPMHRLGQDQTMIMASTLAPQADFMKARLNTFTRVSRVMGMFLAIR